MTPGTLEYRVDLYENGIEEGTMYGWFTGEIDTWGKRTFDYRMRRGHYYFAVDWVGGYDGH